jgi:hypothetical protein
MTVLYDGDIKLLTKILCREIDQDDSLANGTADSRASPGDGRSRQASFLASENKVQSLENGPSAQEHFGGFFFTRRRKYECRFDGLKAGEVCLSLILFYVYFWAS